MKNDLPTLDQRWSIASLALEKHGVDVDKITQKLVQARLLSQLETDEVIGADEDVWQDWVDEYLTEHPAHALPRWHRLIHARKLIAGWHEGWGDIQSDPEPEELAAYKYAVVTWFRGSGIVHSAGDTIENMLEVVLMIQYSEEDPESPDFFVDLDTGEHHNFYRDDIKLQTEITLTYGDHSYTKQFGS